MSSTDSQWIDDDLGELEGMSDSQLTSLCCAKDEDDTGTPTKVCNFRSIFCSSTFHSLADEREEH